MSLAWLLTEWKLLVELQCYGISDLSHANPLKL